MAAPVPSRRWRLCRSCLRGMRNGLLLLLLFLIAAFVYLNEVGLPDFLKRPLVNSLHARGIDLEFSRMRLHWNRGLVAEDVHCNLTQQEPMAPQLAIKEVEVKISHGALVKFHLTIDSLILHGGQLTWRLEETNAPPEILTVTNIQAQLRFLPNDQWALDHFIAGFAGAKFHFSGDLTNAIALRDWKVFHPSKRGQPEMTMKRLRKLANDINQITFSEPPELLVVLHGDARDPRSFNGLLTLDTLGAKTPWGALTNGALTARLSAPGPTNSEPQATIKLHAEKAVTRWGTLTNGLVLFKCIAPGGTNHPMRADLDLHADEAGTPWGNIKGFQVGVHAVGDGTDTNLVRAKLDAAAERFITEWAQATNAHFSAQWTHSITNPIPLAGSAELRMSDARTRWGSVGEVRFNGVGSTPATNGPPQANESWAWWANLEPYFLNWNCRLKDIHAENFELKELNCGGLWRAPDMTVTNLHAEMYQGQLNLFAAVNVATRLLTFGVTSDFDAQKAAGFLTEGGRHWLQQFSWEKPPFAQGNGSLVLPPWTNRKPDWRSEVLPTFSLQGSFKVGAAAFREIPVSSAQSDFSYTNMMWNLPNLVALRPEGRLEMALASDDRTKDFYFSVHSTFDAEILRPVLEEKALRVMDDFVLTEPPVVDAKIWGNWHDLNRIGVKARVAVNNISYREQQATHVHGDLEYTNGFISVINGRVERGTQYMTAPLLRIDIAARRAYLTNGFSTMDAAPVVKAIGPKVASIMEPYQFLQAPTVSANGYIPLGGDVDADLHFKIDGGPFHWLKFNVEHISGGVDWVGDRLNLTGIKGAFYQGKLTGNAAFDFARDHEGANFSFDMIATDSNLHRLAEGLSGHTNNLEGHLSVHLNITQANSHDTNSWFGRGEVDLHDGLIWEIPIFGIFSPVLDGLSPGLGKSRASEGSGTFVITNSVVRSDDLQIRSPVLRMLYWGTVGFDTRVNARVEAELLRDTWLVGPVVSTILKPLSRLFEYKVTGTLSDPKTEPVYLVPKILSFPFHPFKTLQGMGSGGSSGTNAPPVKPP
ncbi:MAG: hypothetical protein JWR26_4102 [Pedosphaera sp.]|nr:hypothetical protein [Pedosphaera sp.]